MRILMFAASAIGLCACATASEPVQREAKAQARYDEMLAGKVAGEPIRCLPIFRSQDMVAIDETTILFRDGRTVYVNRPIGSCGGLGRFSNTLITKSLSSGLCRGDIARVVDLSTGVYQGSCALGDFVPYKPG